jgi:hypothetical protein
MLVRNDLNTLYVYYDYTIEVPCIQFLSPCFLRWNSRLYTTQIKAVSEAKEFPTGTRRQTHAPAGSEQ